jgi:hypothetical protein
MQSLTGLGTALTCAAFSHTVKGAVLRTAPRNVLAPAPTRGLTWAFTWQVLDSNQGRHTSTVLQTVAGTALTWANIRVIRHSGMYLT